MRYIGKTIPNIEVRINEHSDPNTHSEPARHVKANPSHAFQ